MDKIIGLWNALVDVLAPLKEDEMLQKMQLPKGGMTLIGEDKYHIISDIFKEMTVHQSTGGSAGNTIGALAALGVATGFIGKVGNDEKGSFYRHSLEKQGTEAHLLLSSELPSGVASTFISADGERTFATYLGAAATLRAEELALDMFKGCDYFYIEGYLVQDHALILHAIELAKEAGLQICLDLASYNIVKEDLDFFTLLINKYVDVLFANEEEAKAFTGKQAEEAIVEIAQMCSIAVVKLGAQGSLIRKGSDQIHVPACRVDSVVDTTGAGDYFAAGFLYGLTSGYALERCAHIGSVLSQAVIQVVGAELTEEKWIELRKQIENL